MSAWSLVLALSLAQHPAPTADELIQKLDAHGDLKGREKPFEISVSLARLYLAQGRIPEAQAFTKEALAAAEPAFALYVELKTKHAAVAPDADCVMPGEAALASLLEKARAEVKAKRPSSALACARKALTLGPEVLLLDGHSRFIARDVAGARAAYERILSVFGPLPEALYARAALTLDEKPDDVAALTLAKADFEAFLSAAPTSKQAKSAKALLERTTAAIAAGGASKLAPVPAAVAAGSTSPPPLDPAMVAAFQNAPKTPESDAKFAQLIEAGEDALATGRYQEALDSFKQVMPFQPENARLRAGMAWSLVRLGKPMADNVWRVATQTPEAVDALGDRLKAKGDTEGAKAVWARLAATVPSYAARVEAKQ